MKQNDFMRDFEEIFGVSLSWKCLAIGAAFYAAALAAIGIGQLFGY